MRIIAKYFEAAALQAVSGVSVLRTLGAKGDSSEGIVIFVPTLNRREPRFRMGHPAAMGSSNLRIIAER